MYLGNRAGDILAIPRDPLFPRHWGYLRAPTNPCSTLRRSENRPTICPASLTPPTSVPVALGTSMVVKTPVAARTSPCFVPPMSSNSPTICPARLIPYASVPGAFGGSIVVNVSAAVRANPWALPSASVNVPTICSAALIPAGTVAVTPGMSIVTNAPVVARTKPWTVLPARKAPTICPASSIPTSRVAAALYVAYRSPTSFVHAVSLARSVGYQSGRAGIKVWAGGPPDPVRGGPRRRHRSAGRRGREEDGGAGRRETPAAPRTTDYPNSLTFPSIVRSVVTFPMCQPRWKRRNGSIAPIVPKYLLSGVSVLVS